MEYEEDMTILFKPSADFPLDDLLQIALILEQADVLLPGYIPPEVGMYDLSGYFFGSMVDHVRIIMLPDRNIVTRLASAAAGNTVDEQQRLAAAVLAFAQCLDIQIEPSIALHELAPSQGNEAAHGELAYFRLADNSHPQAWIDLALRRTDRLSLGAPAAIPVERDLSAPLHRWRRNYIATLKIGELELLPMAPIERILALFDWMHRDFMLAGPAAIFACHYFAPSFPKKGLLKGLRSSDRSRAIIGASNAAWDITHLSELVRHANGAHGGDTRYLLASFDDGLRRIARTLFASTTEDQSPAKLAEILCAWWPPNQASTIAEALFGHFKKARDRSWLARQQRNPNAIFEFTELGEARLRSWTATDSREISVRPS